MPIPRDQSAPTVAEQGPPEGSGILMVERGGGLSITVPAVRRTSRKAIGLMILFGALYLIISVSHTTWAVVKVLSSPASGTPFSGPLAELPGYVLYWLFGAILVAAGLHYGSRRIAVTVSSRGLQVEVVSLLRQRRWRWSWGEIAEVRDDARGFFLRPVEGKPLRLHWMASSSAEYRWLAETVTKAWPQAGDAAYQSRG